MPQPPMPLERTRAEPAPERPGDPGEERAPKLPEAERRRRRRELWISAAVGLALAGLLLLESLTGLAQSVAGSALFLFLNAVVVFLILLLGFLVTRSLWKLVAERRRGTLGSHLNLKFVSAFVLIAFVTASLLFAVSAVILTQSIDRWFGVQVDSALEKSGRIAERYYEATAQSALLHGGRIAEQITARGLLRGTQPRRAGRPDPHRAAKLRPRRGRGLRRAPRAAGERARSRAAARRIAERRQRAGALGARGPRRLAGGGTRQRRPDPRRRADRIAQAPRAHVRSAGLRLLRRRAARPRRRHHPRDARAVPRAPAERRKHPDRLPARAAARLPRDPDARHLGRLPHHEGRHRTDPRARLGLRGGGARKPRGRRRASGRRRGRLPGALLQPHDARPARCAGAPRAVQRRARPAAPLDGGGARHDRRRRALARRRGSHHHDEPHRAPAARHRAGRQPDREPPRRLRGPGAAARPDRRSGRQAAPGRAREHPPPGPGSARRGARDPAGDGDAAARRGGRRARHGGRARRLHAAGQGAAHGRLARGGEPDRPRDQEPADADPALGAAHPAPLPAAGRRGFRRRQGLRRVRRRHHQPGRRPQAAGRRVLELRAASDGEPAGRAT